jgi:ferrochelatase
VSIDVRPYEALLLVSFGGPEKAADVIPFLTNVTRGRGIPQERLTEVGGHYFELGGRSPINDQCRALLAAIDADFAANGVALPVYWGNRNWHPFLADTIATMAADGVARAACFVTSAYASYSGCRQYRENLYDAVAEASAAGLRLDKLRHYYNHLGFLGPFTDATVAARQQLPAELRSRARLVFVTHSLPTAQDDSSGPGGHAYTAQHLDAAERVALQVKARTGHDQPWALTFCSRSGSPRTPWLEPDINDHLERLAADGVEAVVVVPIGFVSDHMEVRYDLDTEAKSTAQAVGLAFARAATPGTAPGFVSMVRELVVERAGVERGQAVTRPALGPAGPAWDACPVGCCPNLRGARPSLTGAGDLRQLPESRPGCGGVASDGTGHNSLPGPGTT